MPDVMGALATQDSYDDPNAVDWSRLNQPFGVLKDTNPIEYGTASPLVNIRTQDIADATDKAMAFSGGGLGIKAYHSSPHDFDKFDLAKIGTGEGAQVYGHGLYFAESPAVSGQGGQYWNQFLKRFGDEEYLAANKLKNAGFDREAAVALVQKNVDEAAAHLNAGTHPPWLQGGPFDEHTLRSINKNVLYQRQSELDLLRSGKPVGPRTYEVNINADPAHFLDWDKPLSGEAAQKASEALKTAGIDKTLADYIVANKTGKDVYTTLANKKYDTRVMPSDAGAVPASDIMREAGIPGIKYLDQGSRGAGQGSSNYVVFNDKLIDIMRKYGLAGLPAGAAGMGALAQQDNYQQ